MINSSGSVGKGSAASGERRRKRWGVLAGCVCGATAACSGTGQGDPLQEQDVPLTIAAQALRVERPNIADRREALRAYFAEQRAHRHVVATTVTHNGEELDWVPRESTWPDGKVPTPPPAPTDLPPNMGPPQTLADDEMGPPGTVPIQRLDVDSFLDKIDPPASVEAFLSKHHSPADPAVSTHYHVAVRQTVANIGTQANINVFNPAVASNSDFSLGQLWTYAYKGSTVQTVETGWQHFHDLYGDNNPHLFIYYTTNGYTRDGNQVGGYNTSVTGWGQWSANVFPGQTLTPNTSMVQRTELYGNCWWIWNSVANDWLGCYPTSLYGAGGLASGATGLDWGGEVSKIESGTTSTDMGNGQYGNQSGAAAMADLVYQDPNTLAFVNFNGSLLASDDPNPNCYTGQTHFLSNTIYGSYFYYGGPGLNPPTCP